jgi:SAM-dependent methyltransferase
MPTTSDQRIAERGFTHAGISQVAEGNGEDFFLATIDEIVGPDDVVLDLGCGHGELTLAIAEHARTAIGVDRDPGYLALARELADERGATNVRFLELALPHSRLPLADGSVTVVVNRRGPVAEKWLDEVRRVALPGAEVVIMHPAGGPPRPSWAEGLPGFGALPYEQVRSWVVDPLAAAGIDDYRLWWFDVPEWFATGEELRLRIAPDDHSAGWARASGLALRHQRLVARFRLPATR